MSRKAIARVVGGIAIVLLLGLGAWVVFSQPDRITVVTWGGEYARAQARAMFEPFADDTGIEVTGAFYAGGLVELGRQLETGKIVWDVVDFELPDAAEACRKGLLETINPTTIPDAADGADAKPDFVPGAIGPCWVGAVIYSHVIAFDPRRFGTGLPANAADFFDLVRFAGGRGMKDAPKGNLELALVADGVPPKGVYEILSTPEGVSRAFRKLETIRSAIWWWKAPAEPLAMLADGRVAMTTSLSGRVVEAIRTGRGVLSVIWDGQGYEFQAFGVVRGTPRKQDALDFVRFATGTEPLARIAGLQPYGPARFSSLARLGAEAAHQLPSSHMETAVYLDPDWWAVHGPAIEARWREWRRR
jgi:putative spermidine/putrescine transport system substrate-binding protein